MKKIGITFGDTSGIGPEVAIKALAEIGATSRARFRCYAHPDIWKRWSPAIRSLLDMGVVQTVPIAEMPRIPWRSRHAAHGQIALRCLEAAVAECMDGDLDALVTAPVSKENFALAGCPHPGHTTWLAAVTKTPSVSMAFWSRRLLVVLATVHCPLMHVPSLLTPERLDETLAHALDLCQRLGKKNPKIAVAGLNPHAGEHGLIGNEERDILIPWIESKSMRNLIGPLPPDTVFYQAYHRQYDCVIALYHDQGLIPIKMVAFDSAVNISLGLPFTRTSPDHGTAVDIAGQNKANPASMVSAIELAMQL